MAVIGLRTDQIRTGARIEDMRERVVRLRRESWSLQMEIARLRTPEQVADRVGRWALNIEEPLPPSERPTREQLAAVEY